MADTSHLEDVLPTTPLQQGLLYHALESGDSSLYLEQFGFTIEGAFDIERCRDAFARLMVRQPSLRTSFHWEGLEKSYQVIHREAALDFSFHDLSTLSEPDRTSGLAAWRSLDRSRGFGVDRAPLFRVTVHRLGPERHEVTLSLHHVIADGWSLTLLTREFAEIYAMGRSQESGPAPSLRGYVEWLAQQDRDAAAQFWRARLAEISAPTPAPLARDAAADREAASGLLTFALEDSRSLREGARRFGVTESTLFLAAWGLLLARYNRQSVVVFGETVATRPPDVESVDTLVGLLLNVLPAVVPVEEDAPVGDWLRDIQRRQAATRRFDFFPLVEMGALAGLRGNALLNTLVVWENQPGGPAVTAPGAPRVTGTSFYDRSSYALMLAGYPGERIALRMSYSPSRFAADAIDGLLRQMAHLMLSLAEGGDHRVGDLGLAPEPVDESVEPALPARCDLWARFAELVDRDPTAPALIIAATGERITRETLAERAGLIASRVLSLRPDVSALAVRLHPGIDHAAGVLCALLLGVPWLSIDPRRPARAVAERLADEKASCLLTTGDLWEAAQDEGLDVIRLDRETGWTSPPPQRQIPAAQDTACVVFTSGSTGRPKGVELTFAGLANRIDWMARHFPLEVERRGCLKTSPAFVDSVFELLGPLLGGHPALVPDPDIARDPPALGALAAAHDVGHLVVTPTYLAAMLAAEPEPNDRLRLLQISGEALSPSTARQARAAFPRATIVNLYGSSETTADATVEILQSDEPIISIGRPIDGAEVFVLDERGVRAPRGAVGEIHVGGLCLARGYRGDPERTAAAFREWTGPDGRTRRLYVTGDLGSIAEDGRLRYHGRKDRQIKIRGVRVEPEEIELLLRSHADVTEALVVTSPSETGGRLVGYVVAPSARGDDGALRRSLRELLLRRLPSALAPEAFVILDAMPRAATGKLDLAALPPPIFAPSDGQRRGGPPATGTEIRLAEIWRNVLGVENPGVEDDFFDCGGNSILMTQLCFSARREFAVDFPLRAAFEAPDIRRQAALIDALLAGAAPAAAASSALDLEQDIRLADELLRRPMASAPAWTRGGGTLFLSGAQGYINARLLSRLLDGEADRVLCLAPGRDDDEALDGLKRHLSAFGLLTPPRAARLAAIAGDLARPRFGIGEERWRLIAKEADALFHTGVSINFVLPYERLRDPNVLSTRAMIELATTERAKPLHFVGSVNIVDHGGATPGCAAVDETSALSSWRSLPNGYLQARWVSDQMMRRAMTRGLTGSIMRLTTVCGDRVDNRPNPEDFFWRVVAFVIELGAAPDGERPLAFTPIDETVAAVIGLASDPLSLSKAHHLCGETSLRWRDVARVLNRMGHSVALLPGPQWVARMRSEAARHSESRLWREILPIVGDVWRDHETFIPVLSDITRRRLGELGLPLRSMDEPLLEANLRRLVLDGALPRAFSSLAG